MSIVTLAAITKDADTIKSIKNMLTTHSAPMANSMIGHLNRFPKPTLYCDYNELHSDMGRILHDQSDFTSFSLHFCDAFREVVAEKSQSLYTKLKKLDLKLRI